MRVREGDLWILRRPVSVVLQALGSGLQRLDWRRLVCVECTDSVVVDRRQQQRPNGHTSERVVGAYWSQVNISGLRFLSAALVWFGSLFPLRHHSLRRDHCPVCHCLRRIRHVDGSWNSLSEALPQGMPTTVTYVRRSSPSLILAHRGQVLIVVLLVR